MRLEKTYQQLLTRKSTANYDDNGISLPLAELEDYAIIIFNSSLSVWLHPDYPNKILLNEGFVGSNYKGKLQILMGCGFCIRAVKTLSELTIRNGYTFKIELRDRTPAPVFTNNYGKELIGAKNPNIYLKFINDVN